MKDFFENIWAKRVASLFTIPYFLLVFFFAYQSIFFTTEITDTKMFLLLFSAISLFFIVFVIYTRQQIITRAAALLMVPLLLPIFLFNFGQWMLIIPFAVVIIFTFFACGTKEATKTILGTIYLLLFILSSLAYFVFNSLFNTSSNLQLSNVSISPSGLYRANTYTITTVIPNNVRISVEPNDRDEDYKYVKFVLKGYERLSYYNTASPEGEIQWKVDDDGVERLYLVKSPEKGPIFDAKENSKFTWNFLIFEIEPDEDDDKDDSTSKKSTETKTTQKAAVAAK